MLEKIVGNILAENRVQIVHGIKPTLFQLNWKFETEPSKKKKKQGKHTKENPDTTTDKLSNKIAQWLASSVTK